MKSGRREKRLRERLDEPEVADKLRDGGAGGSVAAGVRAIPSEEVARRWAEHRARTSAARARNFERFRPSEAEVEEAQMCALVNFGERMRHEGAVALATAIRMARHDAGKWISPEECLVVIARHCLKVWRPLLNERGPPRPH